MTRIAIELRGLPASEPLTRLLSALACLGHDEELQAVLSQDPQSFYAVIDEQDCECERFTGEDGRRLLIIRRGRCIGTSAWRRAAS